MLLSERARLLCVCQQPQQPDVGLSAPVEDTLSRQHPLMRVRGAEEGFFFHYSVSVRLNRREEKNKNSTPSLTIKLETKQPDSQPCTAEKVQGEKACAG